MQPLLLLVALLLSPKAEAGEIIGGHEAEPHSRPYMAYVRYTSNGSHHCGGFLVREDFVLTAAHCRGSSYTVILGAHNIRVKESTQQVIRVKTPIPHPQYNGTIYVNDIMLLQCGPFTCPRTVKMATTRLSLQSVDHGYITNPVLCLQLENKAKLNDAVRTIELPGRRDKVKPGMVCSVAGWGRLGVNIPGPDKLYEVDLEIQRDEVCNYYFKHYNKELQICVGDPTKIQASYKGDSGGPFVCGLTAQGMVSYGRKSTAKPPRVYTRIKYFLPWIKQTMKRFKLRGPD